MKKREKKRKRNVRRAIKGERVWEGKTYSKTEWEKGSNLYGEKTCAREVPESLHQEVCPDPSGVPGVKGSAK